MQALVNLPSVDTSTKILQEPSIVVVPLQMSTPRSGAYKVLKVIHYGDAFLYEEIVIPQFHFATMSLEDIHLMQVALEKKK